MIVRTELDWFYGPTQQDQLHLWMRTLVKNLKMKLLSGPHSSYVDKGGNRGWTCVCLIETSHIVIHVWDELSPVLAQFDVYTCGELKEREKNIILSSLTRFFPQKTDFKLFDREYSLKEI